MFPVRYGRRNFFNLLSTCFVRGLLVGIWLVDALRSLLGVLVTRVSPVCHRVHLCGCGVVWVGQALGLLVPVGWALLLYTSGLSTPCSVGGLNPIWVGNLILKRASRLDAFSGYHFRT